MRELVSYPSPMCEPEWPGSESGPQVLLVLGAILRLRLTGPSGCYAALRQTGIDGNALLEVKRSFTFSPLLRPSIRSASERNSTPQILSTLRVLPFNPTLGVPGTAKATLDGFATAVQPAQLVQGQHAVLG